MSCPPKEELLERIEGIIRGANLDKTTSRSIRHELESHFNVDLHPHRAELERMILDTTNKLINEGVIVLPKDNVRPDRKTYSSSESDEEPEPPVKRSKKYSNDEALARSLHSEANGMRKRAVSTNKSKNNGSNKTPVKAKTGFARPLELSEEMSAYVGTNEMSRSDLVKKFWAIAREEKLFDPENKQYVICNADWQRLLGVKRFKMFGVAKYLQRHFKPTN